MVEGWRMRGVGSGKSVGGVGGQEGGGVRGIMGGEGIGWAVARGGWGEEGERGMGVWMVGGKWGDWMGMGMLMEGRLEEMWLATWG